MRSAGRLSLAAWLPGRPDFVDLGSVPSRLGSTLTFKISARRFLRDEFATSDDMGDGISDKQQWVLLLQAETKGRRLAASPIMVPSDALRPARNQGRNARLSNSGRRHPTRLGRRYGDADETVARVASSPPGGVKRSVSVRRRSRRSSRSARSPRA